MSLPLVLLPGMMCDARLYGPQIEALSSDYALHVAPIGGYDTVQALANEILANAPPRFALAGLSMGGIVAMEVLRRAPDRLTRTVKLIVRDPSPIDRATRLNGELEDAHRRLRDASRAADATADGGVAAPRMT